jgi:hypothetical protein
MIFNKKKITSIISAKYQIQNIQMTQGQQGNVDFSEYSQKESLLKFTNLEKGGRNKNQQFSKICAF